MSTTINAENSNDTVKSINAISKGWNNRLVIKEENGNQFVWGAIDRTNVEYKTKMVDNKSKGDFISSTHLSNGVKDEYTQIIKYCGFYVGRYETEVPNEYVQIGDNNTKNIYDLAGNIYEYTSTYTSWTSTYVYVRGYYYN